MIYDLESQFDVIYEKDEARICCPFCGDDEGYHLYINQKKGVYHCFRCDKKGSFRQFLREFKILAVQETHKEFKHTTVEDKLSDKKEEIYQIQLENFKPLGISQDFIDNPFYRHIRERGVRVEDIVYYQLHYCYQGKYKYRIIIPCFEDGEFVYFTARTILTGKEKRYLNPPKGVTKYTRSDVVFNIDSLDEHTDCIIMEGALNAIITGRDAVACFGKFVTDGQILKLLAKGCQEYIVSLDSDAMSESLHLAKKLINSNKIVRLVEFPKGQDAADLGREATRELIKNAKQLNYSTIDMELLKHEL